MERLLLILSFIMTGLMPLAFGGYLAHQEEYFISVGCFLISVSGFQQIYYVLKIQEQMKTLKEKVASQQTQIGKQQNTIDQRNKEINKLRDYYDS